MHNFSHNPEVWRFGHVIPSSKAVENFFNVQAGFGHALVLLHQFLDAPFYSIWGHEVGGDSGIEAVGRIKANTREC